ncbi:MAG TPA: hypothetical protein VIZ28_05110 [Chitinophagaceae bacterium]
MEESTQKKENSGQSLVVSYMTIRKAVGVLGMLLPVILVTGLFFFKNCAAVQPSISDYYYTRMSSFFTGTLCAVALFLFSYKGYDKKDSFASNLAGAFALGVAFFPTSPNPDSSPCNIFNITGDATVNIIHFISATLFFLALAYMSYFLFTKSSGHPTREKKMRNNVYKTCAVIIVLSIVGIMLYFEVKALKDLLSGYNIVFYLETIALWAFGFSWLTKGEFLLKDR